MKILLLLLPLVLATACTSDRVIVDRKGLDPAAYEQDLAECRSYASEIDVGADMVRGAAVGAAAGALIGAVIGDSGTTAAGAGVGAVHGGTHQGHRSAEEQQQVVKRCLRGRGYSVLN